MSYSRMDPEPTSSSTDGLTGLLNLGLAGDSSANDRAFQMVYAELRRSAQRQMRRGIDAATLSPTGLVSEVFIKLNDGMPRVNDRAHFYSLAARAMRQILLDHQRDKQAAKRGGKAPHVELIGEPLAGEGEDIDYFALDQALEALRQMDPRAAQVVEWHFFSGLNFIEIAELIGISDKTARRDWDSARAFLLMQLSAG
jgi:RNA polymerase sigma factor (TIGR02999 family)